MTTYYFFLILDINRRFWRKGYELLSAADLLISIDDRMSVVNYSKELTIVNITSSDEGEYTCVVNKKPQYQHTYVLRVRGNNTYEHELFCSFHRI